MIYDTWFGEYYKTYSGVYIDRLGRPDSKKSHEDILKEGGDLHQYEDL